MIKKKLKQRQETRQRRKGEIMSSFNVRDKTINKVVSYLVSTRGYTARVIREAGYNLDGVDAPIKMAHDMRKLNIDAVNQRYSEKSGFQSIGMKYNLIPGIKQIYALKALNCWLYQCSEGDVPGTKLYKLMDRISNMMAQDIVSDLPEYDKAGWDQ